MPFLQKFFQEYFSDDYPIAIKDIRYFFASVLCRAPEYNVRIIVLRRALEARLQSGYEMIKDGLTYITPEQMRQWATAWQAYETKILGALPAAKLIVQFNDLIDTPKDTLDRIGNFIETPLPFPHLVDHNLRHH